MTHRTESRPLPRRLAMLLLGTALTCALGACSPGGTMPESNEKLDNRVL